MKWIQRLTRIELVLIYLVILAGSIVRMTGSGMGCPDWPKCFGYLIPPSERSQLEWQPKREFKKGQIIIRNESLRVARNNFTTGSKYQEENWAPYTKHNYAQFNPAHTWTEYINRLMGALSGIPMLLLVLFSFRQHWRFILLSLCGLFLLGFEAWLGKLVVDGNLIPGSITIHMIGSLIIIALLCVLLGMTSYSEMPKIKFTPTFRNLLFLSLLFSLIQIISGTQIREQVDLLNDEGVMRNNWIESLNWEFYFHRTFSLFILIVNVWLWWVNRRLKLGYKELHPILALVVLEIILGIIMAYLNVPRLAQPLHLLLGALLFGFQFYAVVRYFTAEKARVILT